MASRAIRETRSSTTSFARPRRTSVSAWPRVRPRYRSTLRKADSVKLDPTKRLLRAFIELNNRVIERFAPAERRRIGVHTCPGGDQDSTHSADVDYGELLPSLFHLKAGNFYIELASEQDRGRVLRIII